MSAVSLSSNRLEGYMGSSGRNVTHLERVPLLEDKDLAIRWDALIPSGKGTRHQRHVLVKSTKQLFELMYGASNIRGKNYGETTKLQKFGKLRALVRWMVRNSIWRFSDISQKDIVKFIASRRPRKDALSEHTVASWISKLQLMFDLAGKYDFSLTVDIRTIDDQIYEKVRGRPARPWKSLDANITIALIRDALQWIQDFAPFFESVAEESWLRSRRTIGLSKTKRSVVSNKFYKEISEKPEYKKLAESLNFSGPIYKTISVGLSVTEGACAFLLLVLVGFRVSELLSLNKDCLIVEEVEGKSGLGYIKGIAAKKQGRARRWVAGVPVQEVINFLLRLTKHTRSPHIKSQALLLSRSKGSPLFWIGSAPARWGSLTLSNRVKLFACSGMRKGGAKVSHLHPHMLRKTFAQLAVLRDKSRLEPVAAQLGHVYQSFTDNRYIGINHDLATLLAEEDRKELASGLEVLLTSTAVGGKGAAALSAVRGQAAKFRGKKTLRAFIEKLIDEGVLLGPCHWGFCVYSRSHSACDGSDTGPNLVNRAPDICAGCVNLAVTEKHISWWNDRARDQELFLARPRLPTQTRLVVEEKLKKSVSVLAGLVKASAGVASASTEKI
ncbi:site-specific integrase [Paraburkholderia acidipaludis]|uniref:site-specific integrase n=1 Tax=Paraburkholderia acidipaludis TaxID=660537 RepID=UPI000A062134|nr:site-specific integrase [Paraburkholderia acidipaludis]